MSNDVGNRQNQKKAELDVFHEFASVWTLCRKVTSRDEPEPDILCECISGETVAFELVSCEDVRYDESLVEEPREDASYVTLSFCNRIKGKLNKKYETDHRIHLLAYSLTVTSEEFWGTGTGAKLVNVLTSNGMGRFDRIYVFGRRCSSIIFDSASDM